jgi:pentatricopeptide repeat protein
MDRRGAKRHQFLPCVAYAAEMKEKRIEPNLVIYNSMLAATAEDGLWLDSWAILDDMLLMGIKPNAMSFSHLLHVSSSPQFTELLLTQTYTGSPLQKQPIRRESP